MKFLKTTMLVSVMSIAAPVGYAQAEDALVIAGRDGNYAEALNMVVDMYKTANPGLEVEQLELPYDGLREKAVIASREKSGAYDVMMLDDTWAPQFMSNGWLADLEALGGVDEDFVSGAANASRYPVGTGPFYAVPFVGNVELFAFRSDLLEKYGFGAPESWDEVVAAAKAVSEGEEGVAGVVFRGIKGNPIVTGFLPILWAHGGSIIDADGNASINSPEALAALELYLSLKPYAPKGVETYNSSEVRDALMQGTAAIAIELWPSWAPALDDPEQSKVPGLIEIQAAPGQTAGPSPMLGAWLVGIPADSDNAERARDFIDFLTSADVQKKLALELGIPPTRSSVYSDADVVAKYRWYPAQEAALQNARPRPRTEKWSELEAIMGDYLQLALIGEMTPAAALEEAQGKIERALR